MYKKWHFFRKSRFLPKKNWKSQKRFFWKTKVLSKSKHFVRYYLISIFLLSKLNLETKKKYKRVKNSKKANLKVIEQKKCKVYESKEYVLVSISGFIYLFVLLFLDNFLRKKGIFDLIIFHFLKDSFFSKPKHFVTYLTAIFYFLSKIIIRIKSPKTKSNICVLLKHGKGSSR